MESPTVESKEFELGREHELRIDVAEGQQATIKLIRGQAEIFGTEMAPQRDLVVGAGRKAAVFSWTGAVVRVDGALHSSYVSRDTPMRTYLNTHVGLDQRRERAAQQHTRGPRVLIVGPVDVGKSTLSQILVNYAVRQNRQPIFVDLDVGQNSLSIPGTIAAVVAEEVLRLDEARLSSPYILHFGHTSPAENLTLYRLLVKKLADTIAARCASDGAAETSGCIVNTCGWVEGPGYELLVDTISVLDIDVVLVLDQERLYNDLLQKCASMDRPISVVRLNKSGGVSVRSKIHRKVQRNAAVRSYFYGLGRELSPASIVLRFDDIEIFKVGAPPIPESCLPLGTKASDTETKVVPCTTIGRDVLHGLLSVSTADKKEALATASIMGFLYVTDVNTVRRELTCLAPCPGRLPRRYLLLSTVRWQESE